VVADVGAIQTGPADVDEQSSWSERVEGARAVVIADRIEHHVDAGYRLREVGGGVVDQLIGT
jgi:hypothetical protein